MIFKVHFQFGDNNNKNVKEMERYNYRQAVKESIYDYIKEDLIDLKLENVDRQNLDDLEDYLYELVINDDLVTGNMSGSFFCNSYKAEECLCHNFNEMSSALEYWEIPLEDCKRFIDCPELMDVLIRMTYVREVVCEIVKEINEK